jgi:hypothetical protein
MLADESVITSSENWVIPCELKRYPTDSYWLTTSFENIEGSSSKDKQYLQNMLLDDGVIMSSDNWAIP